MFTGIIEGLGTVALVKPVAGGSRLTVTADFALEGTGIGDSIAVNGACLTAVSLQGPRFSVDVSPETLSKTTFNKVKIGDRVNLERALRLSDRLDGHLVSGHIDGLGTIKGKQKQGNAIVVTFAVSAALAHYMIPKGSVAIDGISLTINSCEKQSFSVSIIPHTAGITTIGLKDAGDTVNIETDMLGKYVEKFVHKEGRASREKRDPESLDMQFLAKTGFL
ncbi:MAG: riboflavin synthase [Desulfobacterales bacterium]|nr:riboflavin synthase [Desulfobacterales bacterium]